MWSISPLAWAAWACCAFVLAGCELPTDCKGGGPLEVSPADTTVRRGAEFTASMQAFTCGGSRRLEIRAEWSSTDPAVLSVDRTSGRVRALAPGSARVLGFDEGPSKAGSASISVTVIE
jgi:hypothetical protein